MQEIYVKTPLQKCDFNKFSKQLYWYCTSRQVKLLQIFKTLRVNVSLPDPKSGNFDSFPTSYATTTNLTTHLHDIKFHQFPWAILRKLASFLLTKMKEFWKNRSSEWRCSVREGFLRNFPKITVKHLCQILFFKKERLFYRTPMGDCLQKVFTLHLFTETWLLFDSS